MTFKNMKNVGQGETLKGQGGTYLGAGWDMMGQGGTH